MRGNLMNVGKDQVKLNDVRATEVPNALHRICESSRQDRL